MRFSENMIGLCIMSVMLEFLLLRLRGRATPLHRTIIAASIVSGLSWLAVWVWVARVGWNWKTPDFWTAHPALDVFSLAVAGLMWCCFAAIPAILTGLIYRRYLR